MLSLMWFYSYGRPSHFSNISSADSTTVPVKTLEVSGTVMTTFGDVGVPVMDSHQLCNSWVRESRSVMHRTIIQTGFLNKLDFSESHL